MLIIKRVIQALTRPLFIIGLLSYFVLIIGLHVVTPLGLANIFTLFFIPFTFAVIYSIWNAVYNTNINDEMFDSEIEKKYFRQLYWNDKRTVKKLSKLREEIQKLSSRTDLNPSKQSLLAEIQNLNFNDLIDKYCQNGIRLKIIEDYLKKTKNPSSSIAETIKKLDNARSRYHDLNETIIDTFHTIQAQALLLLADDAGIKEYSRESVDDIIKRIEILDKSNTEINNFYGSIHQGEHYE